MRTERATRPLLLLAAVVIIAGCSFQFLYRQLDWLVPWYVSDYIELNGVQQSELEQQLGQQLRWHCSTQLQHYAVWLRSLHDTADAFSRRQLERHYRQTQAYWAELAGRIAEGAAPILITASEPQLEALAHNLERHNRELEQEYQALEPAERLQRRRERMVRTLERWLGELTTAQQQLVADWSQGLGEVDVAAWMMNRRRWQQALVATVRDSDERTELSRRLRGLLVEPEQHWSEAYRREQQRRVALTLDLLAAVAAAMSASQQAHLKHELLGWAGQFDSLACAPDRD
jgi:hypothetical protein